MATPSLHEVVQFATVIDSGANMDSTHRSSGSSPTQDEHAGSSGWDRKKSASIEVEEIPTADAIDRNTLRLQEGKNTVVVDDNITLAVGVGPDLFIVNTLHNMDEKKTIFEIASMGNSGVDVGDDPRL
jgi:hypothetical protein